MSAANIPGGDINPVAGRKVFFLSHDPQTKQIVAGLRAKEFEAYAIADYRDGKNLLRQYPGSVCIINIDRQMQQSMWRAFASSINRDRKLSGTILGVLSVSFTEENVTKLFEGVKLDAGITVLGRASKLEDAVEKYAQILDKFGAKGRRQYVRALCANDKNARLYWIDGKMFIHQMKVLDISVAAAAVSVPATLAGKLKAPQSLPSATLLLGRYQHVIYPTVLMTKEANGKEIAVLMFAGGLDEETTASIRSYVFTGLYEQTMMAINGLPKDSENYHELEEQNKLVKSMESSVQPEKPKNAEP